uniref:Exonuclease 1 n=1 Tax=Geotrypetes seraphini TaxID=260995 RepID=A0A6P8R394_GEOSA|nr:exonuclease 1 [Geotrypetes seraphini]XP_033793141.1 exonuclease 1 [Geotrypetes seraphini]XP_033793142.1 exonuclease 1 [Geotrypetes seraphini]
MGIQGLLQFIKEASEPIHVKKFKGQTVAVDTYCWLHKGAFACAEKLAKGEHTDQYVAFCMKFVDMLISFGVKPILVFDGCTLPSKNEVEKARRERRQANLQKGKQLLREGKVTEARECFTRSINITSAMAHDVIKVVRAQGIDCIVAPYEADSQLAYLNKVGIAQAIITEDSDLLAFGCKKVILKMDKFGNGLEIDQARFGMCKQLGDVFTEEKFRYMCILSGCDYLPSIHGIGLAKACKLLRMTTNPDIIKVIKKIGQYLKMNIVVPEEYLEGFVRANNTFLYQLVFDPLKRELVPLNPYPSDIDPQTLDYAGRNIGHNIALQIALGNIDINTMEQIDNFNPDISQPSQSRSCKWNDSIINQKMSNSNSIWNRNYRPNTNLCSPVMSVESVRKPCTKGMEKIISTKVLKLLHKTPVVKRPRDEELSEADLLSQYSFSSAKKGKQENCKDDEIPQKSSSEIAALHSSEKSFSRENSGAQPKMRNKFATFLQKKNQENSSVIVPGTRSRFFCDSTDATIAPNAFKRTPEKLTLDNEGISKIDERKDLLNFAEENNGDDCNDQVFSSPVEENLRKTISHSPLERNKHFFNWSGSLEEETLRTSNQSSTLLSLQKFHRRNSHLTLGFQNNRNLCVYNGSQGDSDKSTNEASSLSGTEHSSLSQGDTGFSQNSFDNSRTSVSSSKDSISEGSASSPVSSDNPSPPSSPLFCNLLPEKKSTTLRAKVSGLHKSRSVGSGLMTKLKSMAPAKVSGLSKKLTTTQKKNHQNNENSPGLQVTINDLWKNFGFKKHSDALPSCKKTEPLSPVKDNLVLTPETDEDICNKSECGHVQRWLFT